VKVVWTSESVRKLEEIEAFIAQDNPKRASDFIDLLLEKGDLIELYPSMGRVVPELSHPEFRELLVENYRIVYRSTVQRIEILTVFEGHRLLRMEELH
jgi:addiction module RelE/StbE family toxin